MQCKHKYHLHSNLKKQHLQKSWYQHILTFLNIQWPDYCLYLILLILKNFYHNIIHNVYESSHSYKNYYKTTQNGISNIEMNHMIIMAGENYHNKFLIINWYFVPKHLKYTFLSPNFSISRNHTTKVVAWFNNLRLA